MYTIETHRLKEPRNNIVGYAQVNFGGAFELKGISIIEKKDGTLFAAFPSHQKKDKDGNPLKDENGFDKREYVFNPITAEFREELLSNILTAFDSNLKVFTCEEEVTEAPSFDVRVTPYTKEDSNIAALATAYLDDRLAVSKIVVHQNKKGQMSVYMPSYASKAKTKDGEPIYKRYCYATDDEFKKKLNTAIKEAAKNAIEERSQKQTQAPKRKSAVR